MRATHGGGNQRCWYGLLRPAGGRVPKEKKRKEGTPLAPGPTLAPGSPVSTGTSMPFGASNATKVDDAKPPAGISAVAVIIPVAGFLAGFLAGCLAVYYYKKRSENVPASSTNEVPMNPMGEGRRGSL